MCKHIYAARRAFAALKVDGSVVAWGDEGWGGDCSKVRAQLTVDEQHIYATDGAFAALKAGGSVVTWGSKFSGGDSSPVQAQIAVDVEAHLRHARRFCSIEG